MKKEAQKTQPTIPARVDRNKQYYLFFHQNEAGITQAEVRQAVDEYLKKRKL